MSQTQPVKWIICWRNKYENIFTHINITHMKEEKKNRKKSKFGEIMWTILHHIKLLDIWSNSNFQAFTYYYLVIVQLLEQPESNLKAE